MSDRAAYSRVYWSVMDDPKFDGIREDPRRFGSWSILLIAADMAWPAPAYVPSTVPRSCYRALVTAGLVDELTGGRFRIHGLAAERGRRRDAATRSGTGRDPDGSQTGGNREPDGALDEAETRQDEEKTSRGSARESLPGDDGRADLEAYLLITRRAPSPRQRQVLDGVLQFHDLSGPQWSADIMLRHPDDPIGAVIAADKAWRAERIEEAKNQEVTKVIPHRPKARGLTGVNAELAALYREIEANQSKDGSA